ncbi:MAG: RDD family protein [Planctomycetota bacterium]|jgi:uncharacterized RDD family membrane protein YckC
MARYRVTTPEQVQFHYETAGLMSRAMAWAFDQVILTFFRVLIYVLLLQLYQQLHWASGKSVAGIALALLFLLIFLLDFGYYLFFELRWSGQSPGKRLFGLRVISSTGGRLDFSVALMRNLMRPLDTLPLCMFTGGTIAFLDPLNRRLGDFVAETLVICEARSALPESLPAQHTRVNSFQSDPAIRQRILARVNREERDLILDLMHRRDELKPEIREELFSQVAEIFKRRYSLPEDQDHLSDEQTVVNLALVIQGQNFAL